MKPLPGSLKKVFLALAMLIGSLILFGGYFVFQLLAEVEVPGMELPNNLDIKEANRKLGLFEKAHKESQRGFIRLPEVEINAYLGERFTLDPEQSKTNAPVNGWQLSKCYVDLMEKEIVFYCWLQRTWMGKHWTIVWQRGGEPEWTKNRWSFKLQSMHIGRQQIPERFWPQVEAALGTVDRVFADQLKQFAELPDLELKPNEFSKHSELRLYTYSNTNLSHHVER